MGEGEEEIVDEESAGAAGWMNAVILDSDWIGMAPKVVTDERLSGGLNQAVAVAVSAMTDMAATGVVVTNALTTDGVSARG